MNTIYPGLSGFQSKQWDELDLLFTKMTNTYTENTIKFIICCMKIKEMVGLNMTIDET